MLDRKRGAERGAPLRVWRCRYPSEEEAGRSSRIGAVLKPLRRRSFGSCRGSRRCCALYFSARSLCLSARACSLKSARENLVQRSSAASARALRTSSRNSRARSVSGWESPRTRLDLRKTSSRIVAASETPSSAAPPARKRARAYQVRTSRVKASSGPWRSMIAGSSSRANDCASSNSRAATKYSVRLHTAMS